MGVIDILSSVSKMLPTIKPPERPPSTNERLTWTAITLIIFFIMYHVTVIGVSSKFESIDFLQTITASKIGSLLTAGIGPIVLASIFLQLFVGAKLINLNLQDKNDRKKFHEAQKVLAIILALVEAAIFVFTSRVFLVPVVGGFTPLIVVFQIALGSIILQYLDEIVSKYGIGSGISLFIAAGVSVAVIGGLMNLIGGAGGVVEVMATGGAEAIPGALLVLLPFIFTILVFLIVVYAEGIKVEIPIAFEQVRGMSPKLPLKFFYVSNIPVIFASALLLNVQLFATMLAGKSLEIGGFDIIKAIGFVDSSNQLRDGLLYLLTPVYAGRGTVAHWNLLTSAVTPIFGIPEWVHAAIYILFLSVVSILFGLFWVETSNMDARSVAGQLGNSGLQIPGFRRDPRMLEGILNKHILPLTVLGSFSVGLLAGLADLTGALGTGTGILLTVGILYRVYEQMEQMKMFDLYPSLGKIF